MNQQSNIYQGAEFSTSKASKSMKQFSVKKRDGRIEPGDVNKIHKVCTYACEGIDGVSVSELEMAIYPHLHDGMTTVAINNQVVSACKSLMTSGRYHYDKVGGRINSFIVRKEAYGRFKPPALLEIVKANIAIGRYDPDITGFYSEADWAQIDAMIDHDRDELFRLAGSEQMRAKYLSRNRVTGKICESFQIPFILVAAILFRNMTVPAERMAMIKACYDCTSIFDISLPTPQMSGIRTITKQFASCVLIDAGDSIDEINAASSAIVKYVAKKAGLGVNVGRIRGIGAPINGGEAVHTGLLPFLKKFTADTKSCSQGGVRDGAVTFYFPIWHYETPELLLLKSNTLPEEQTNRRADYGVQFNAYMWMRLINEEKVSLFSPYDTPGLYDAFHSDQEEFARLYEMYEADKSIRRRTMEAQELFSTFATWRSNSGRYYVSNVDLINNNGSFQVPVTQSNLCAEITLPSVALQDLRDIELAEIAICNLANVNMGKIKSPKDLKAPCTMAVHMLEEVLDYTVYPVPAAEKATMDRRPLGIGIMGLAHFLAKRGLKYDRDALGTVDEYMEAFAYYLIRASVDIAKVKGPCPKWKETKYAIPGWFPHRVRNAALDELVPFQERMPWDELADDIQKYGIRNSTLMAVPPGETSSQISNSTNGGEPARGPVVIKVSKDTSPPIAVPEIDELKDKYDYLWNQQGPEGYLEVTAFIQKWIDQAMSINTSYNPMQYKDERLSTEMLLGHMIRARQLGHKNLYYQNTFKPGEEQILGLDLIEPKKGQLEDDLSEMALGESNADGCEACDI